MRPVSTPLTPPTPCYTPLTISMQQRLPLPLLLALCAFLDSAAAGPGYDIAVEYDGQDVTYAGQWNVEGHYPNDTIFTATEGSTVQVQFSGAPPLSLLLPYFPTGH
ncbi:hypothetical protein CALCODRAFT_306817 [Calocera cornea HHB12733]|uniref:Uncharacterized protein n=1 Tax=Calocera cornea HHB12733 TaxID=1353952 RepID=A0A165JMA3_9BASI|nr:hypothetical protein CALCODRAFT_306817 [Calocera cornea HHB12733]